MIEGLDISQWQGNVNFDLVPYDRYKFVILRVSVGKFIIDTKFEAYYNALKNKPVELGFYYATVENQNGREQADVFLDRLTAVTGGIPKLLVVDYERNDNVANNVSQAMLHDTVYRLRERSPWESSWQPTFYSSKSKVDELLQEWGEFPDFCNQMNLWIAHYSTNRPAIPEPWTMWTFHQDSSTHSVPGFPGNVDHNWFRGTMADLRFRTGKIPPFGARLAELEKKAHQH